MDRYSFREIIIRIAPDGESNTVDVNVYKSDDGEFVRYSDVEALQARVRELEGIVGLMKAKIHNDATNAKSATQITTDTKGTP